MPGRDDGLWVLWPHYFDARLSRKAGRRVPSHLAISKPDAAWIQSAAKKAGFEADLDEEACHPSIPYKVVGRVLVQKRGSKEAALQAIAKQMQA
ncbi:MAG: signal recognition particle subunit SRP19/SEC65 family protein [Thermoplasmatota archaeon]